MPEIPWQSLSPFDSSRTYLALLTHLPLRSYWRIPQFLGFTAQLRRQLTGSNGVIGYAMLAWPLRKEFWTLSVWEDADALMAFVRHPPHTRGDAGPHGASGYDEIHPLGDERLGRAAYLAGCVHPVPRRVATLHVP